MLVRRGASVTYRDELGNAPLHEAVRKNMIEVVKVSSEAKQEIGVAIKLAMNDLNLT